MKAVLGECTMNMESNIVVFFPPALIGYSLWKSQVFSVFFVWAGPALWLHRGYFSGYRRNFVDSAWFVLNPFRRILRSISSSSSSAFLTSYSSSTSWIGRAWSIQGTPSQSSWCFQEIFSIPAEDLLLTHGVAVMSTSNVCEALHGGIITALRDRE